MALTHTAWRSLGKPVVVAATAVLALLGVIGNRDKLWVWIVAAACALIIVLIEIAAWRQDNRLQQNYEILLSRILGLIADLSDLTAREFDLWVVDLYLPRKKLSYFLRRQISELDLAIHVTLTDVRTVPNKIKLDESFGKCFIDRRGKLWWDAEFAPNSKENYAAHLGHSDNAVVAANYGVASVNPVVNHVGNECRGLLVVHAKRDPEIVTKVLGVLQQSEGRRRMAAACLDIHGHLRKS